MKIRLLIAGFLMLTLSAFAGVTSGPIPGGGGGSGGATNGIQQLNGNGTNTTLVNAVASGTFTGNGAGLTNLSGGGGIATFNGVGTNTTITGVNLVPANAQWSGSAYTLPSTLATNVNYVVRFIDALGNEVVFDNTLGVALAANANNSNTTFLLTAPIAQPLVLYDSLAADGTAINIKIYAVTNLIVGNMQGTFTGTVLPGSTVSNSSLESSVVIAKTPLYQFVTGPIDQHYLVSSNSGHGSTLGIWNDGSGSGANFADINFLTGHNGTDVPANAKLRMAIGVGLRTEDGGHDQFPYNDGYVELYAQRGAFWYVGQAGPIYGGSNGTNGNFYWFGNKGTDADYSTKFFELSRSNSMCYVSNLNVGGGFITTATNTLAITATGQTNTTGTNYLLSVTAGTGMTMKDGNGGGIFTPVIGGAYPFKPGWRFAGAAITALAVQQ